MDQFAYNLTTKEIHWIGGITAQCNVGFVAEGTGNIRPYAYLSAIRTDHPDSDFCGHCFRSRINQKDHEKKPATPKRKKKAKTRTRK